MTAFKAYDIRGIYGEALTRDIVYRVGRFLPGLLDADRVLVGRDARASSPEVFDALARGLTEQGADVYDIGLASTPMVYYATAAHNFPASVMITASHNPPHHNGLKVSRRDALPVGYDTGLGDLERLVISADLPACPEPGTIKPFALREDYIKFLKPYVPELGTMKVGIDCSNGMGALVVKDLLGDAPAYIYDDIDGTFPNHAPNPLVLDNVQDLIKLVRENELDIGVIFDGDADRVMFVDERGEFVPPDLITGVLGNALLTPGEPASVLHDIRTSKAVSDYLVKLGAIPVMWKVGHSFAKVKLREIKGLFGGELAGHYYFRDFYYCDCGMLACLIVLEVAAAAHRKGLPFSALIDQVGRRPNSGELNFRVSDKAGAMDAVVSALTAEETPVARYDFDGHRIEFEAWWFNIRPSNTEPYLRLIAEAKTDKRLAECVARLKTLLEPFIEPGE